MKRDYTSTGEWKIQLAISIQFISSRNPEQFCIRHPNSKNTQIMSGSDKDYADNDLLLSLKENCINHLLRMDGIEYHFERVTNI